MGFGGAVYADAFADRTAPRDGLAIGGERDPLYGLDRLSVAATSEGVSAVLDGSGLFLCLARYRKVAKDRQSSGPASPPETWT